MRRQDSAKREELGNSVEDNSYSDDADQTQREQIGHEAERRNPERRRIKRVRKVDLYESRKHSDTMSAALSINWTSRLVRCDINGLTSPIKLQTVVGRSLRRPQTELNSARWIQSNSKTLNQIQKTTCTSGRDGIVGRSERGVRAARGDAEVVSAEYVPSV